MSIASEITRIKNNISSAYNKLEKKGAILPSKYNSDNLGDVIDTISVGKYNVEQVIVDGGCELNITDAGHNINIPLPIEFNEASNIYYFKVSDDKVLLSSDTNIGLWVYDITSNMCQQKHDNGKWTKFQTLENGYCLIISTTQSDVGVLLYNSTNNLIEYFSYNGSWEEITLLQNGNCLISDYFGSGILLYNSTNNTITKIQDDNMGYGKGILLSNGNCLFGAEDGFSSLKYDIKNNTITKISDDVSILADYDIHLFANGDCLCACSGKSTTGIFLYDAYNNTFNLLYEIDPFYTRPYFQLTNGNVVFSSATNIFVYDTNSKQITKLDYVGYQISFFQTLSNSRCLFYSPSTTNGGIYLYNDIDKTITLIYSKNKNRDWSSSGVLLGGKYLLSGSNLEMLLYNENTNTIELKYPETSGGKNYRVLPNGNCLIEKENGIKYLYNNADETIKIYSFTI